MSAVRSRHRPPAFSSAHPATAATVAGASTAREYAGSAGVVAAAANAKQGRRRSKREPRVCDPRLARLPPSCCDLAPALRPAENSARTALPRRPAIDPSGSDRLLQFLGGAEGDLLARLD